MHRSLLAAASAIALLAGAGLARAESATSATGSSGIDGPALSAIPVVRQPMSLLRLSGAKASTIFAREVLTSVAPKAASATRKLNGPQGFLEGSRLAGYVSADGAATEVFPHLESLPAGSLDPATAIRAASGVFARSDLIPRDDTIATAAPSRTLYRGLARPRGAGRSGTAAAPILTYVAARRQVDGLPVFGRGSRASVGFGQDGSVQALAKHWRAATRVGVITPTISPSAVRAAILRQLQPLASTNTHIVVDRVGLGYYDADRSFIQPVYYFTARLLPVGAARQALTDGDAVIGYVPVGRLAEPIPDLAQRGRQPSPPANHGGSGVAPQDIPSNYISEGSYIVQNDDPNWLANANEFMQGLTDGGNSLFAPNVDPIPFLRTQYYWAASFEYLADANSYVNTVEVVDTEAHGDWWLFTSYQNWGDVVDLHNVGVSGNPAYGGFGAGNAGQMAHWMIHSCEVIPSMFDLQATTGNYWDAFTPWWNIFNGLHNVVGYRTIMFIDDDTGYPYGYSLGLGGQVTQAWFNTVSAAPDYNNGWTYFSGHLNTTVPYGEPSAMSIPGLENESAYSNWPASPASQTGLYNFYLVGNPD